MNLGSTRRHASRVGVRAIFALAVLSMSGASALALPLHYFVVAENPSTISPCIRCDSYILPLSDPDDIARARTIIAAGGKFPDNEILAKIVAGSDGINRNVLAPGAPLWSWHVTEFLLFAISAIPEARSWPQLVESDVQEWIATWPADEAGTGLIIFPLYTVVAEIPEPGSLARRAAGSSCSSGDDRAGRAGARQSSSTHPRRHQDADITLDGNTRKRAGIRSDPLPGDAGCSRSGVGDARDTRGMGRIASAADPRD